MSSSKRMRSISRARGETSCHKAIELRALLGALEVGILGAERVLQRHRVAGLALRRVQRQRAARAARLHRLEDLLVADADRLGQLAGRRRAIELLREARQRALDAQRDLLDAARRAHHPRLIAEVSLELAGDRRDREGAERVAAGRVVAIDRLHQRDRRDLDEVLQRLAATLVATGQRPRERQEALDQQCAGTAIATVDPGAKQAQVFTRAPVAADVTARRCLCFTVAAGDGRVQCCHVLTSRCRALDDRRNLSAATSEAVVPGVCGTHGGTPENGGSAPRRFLSCAWSKVS